MTPEPTTKGDSLMYDPIIPFKKPNPSWKQLSFKEVMDLDEDGYPYLIFTNNLTSWISNIIKKHTAGEYSHVLWKMDKICGISQGWILKKINFSKTYLRGNHRVKIWRVKTASLNQKYAMFYDIKMQLYKPWYKKLYDWPGIIGQLFRMRWINYPWRNYCSESINEVLSLYTSFDMKHPSPSDINKWCEWHQEEVECIGVYEPDVTIKRTRFKRLYNNPLRGHRYEV